LITNQEIRLIKSLDSKSERLDNGLFVVEGVKNVEELISSDYEIVKVLSTSEYFSKVASFEKVTDKELSRITHLKTPNQVLALVKIPTYSEPIKGETTLVIDGVNDPGNLGTIIRTADWFGIRQIVCSENSVDVYSPKVVMSTMGSIFRVRVVYTSLVDFIKNSPLKSYAAVLNGMDLNETKFDSNALLVMGSESHGISEPVQKVCSNIITISGSGNCESLNLGIATGIICNQYFNR
jgi:TrmH family RNA methyltransferase